MMQISVSQARQDFLKLANRVYAGEEFLVVKNKIPMMILKPVKIKKAMKRKIDPKMFGMWKDRWPKNKSSVEVVNQWRAQSWRGRYDR